MSASEARTGSRLLRWLVSGIWTLAVFILLLVALYVGIGRYLVAQVGVYEADLESLLSQRLGRPVQIDTLSGTWVGLDPVILVDDLSVGGSDSPDAALQRLRIRLATVASLARGRLVFREFSASHADLTLTQDAQGVLGLAGLWQPTVDEVSGLELIEAAAQDFDSRFSGWIEELGDILADPVVHVSDLRLTVRTPDHADQHYQVPAIDLAFRRGIFSADGRLTRIDNAETIAWFTLEGKHFFSGSFSGTLYLDIRSERLFDTFLQRYEWFDVGIEGLDLRTSVWLTFDGGSVSRALAEVSTPYLQLRSPSATLPPIEDLDVTLAARRLESQCSQQAPCGPVWEIQARDLRYRWLDQAVGPTDLRWVKAPESWKLAVDTIALGSVAELAVGLEVLPDAAHRALSAYRPTGELSRLTVDYVGTGDYRVTADLRQVAVEAVDGAPVVQGLDGWLEHEPGGGRLLFDSAGIVFGFPELFSGAWQFDRMTGEVAWLKNDPGWRILGRDLRFQYSAETVLGGDFELSLSPERRNTLGLRVGLLNADHSHLAHFLPVGVVGDSLYDWLTNAMVGGEIPWGWYYGYGPVERETEGQPETGPFTSAMAFDFRNLDFAYAEDWPALQEGRGQFRYQGELGWVDIDEAQVGGVELQPSQVLVDTSEPATRVEVNTAATVTGADLQYWADNSALAELAGSITDSVNIDGAADLALGLTFFPGAETAAEPAVDASLELQGLSIAHPASGYQWRRLTGTVEYDSEGGFASRDVKGRFLDHEARFDLAGGAGGRPVEIHQWGRATVAEVNDQLGQALPFIAGEFDYDLRASLGEEAKPSLGFQVNLEHVAVDLPSPLAKESGAPGRLQGNLVLEEGERLRLQGAWEERLAFQMLWQESELAEASLVLGGETAPLREGRYFLGGTADRLDLDEWYEALMPLLSSDAASAEPEASPALSAMPLRADFSVRQLIVGGTDFGAVDLSLLPAAENWRVEVQGPRLAGDFTWREEGPHQLEFARLVLPSDEEPALAEAGPELSGEVGRRYPSADVRIDELWLGKTNYGQWQFQVRPSADALAINALKAQTGSLTFNGRLIWQYDRGGKDLTRLSGNLEGDNIRDLNAWVDAGVPLDSKSTRARLELAWPGSPQSFSLAELQGEMALSLKDGTILDQNNVAQVFRIFGILNADTLLRRLRLDFSDLYQAGVSFEALSGKAVVKDGILTLDPELQLTGPSGAFRLTGSTHLIRETLDMRLVVVLPLTQNLPVAALLFGAAAPIGGALFILDKLLGDPLSKLTSATYEVSGVWEEPEVKLRNIFDTGSDLRNYERPKLEEEPPASPGQVPGEPDTKETGRSSSESGEAQP